jgi:type III secretion system YscD/HrpQ family protein
MNDQHDTIFDDETPKESAQSAEVNFDLLEGIGKWLVKVVSGPNSGAEFSLSSGTSYLLGTDASSCDIIFNDLSVSRQHAKLSLDRDDRVYVEDLGSKNGTMVDSEKITTKKAVSSNALVTMGTTTFLLINREGEHHTIISLPTSLAPAKKEEEKEEREEMPIKPIQEAVLAPIQSEIEKIKEDEKKAARHAHAVSAFVVLATVTALFVVAGIGTTLLFKTQKVEQQNTEDPDVLIRQSLKDFSSIRYSYNPTNGKLLLIGHLLSGADRSKMLDNLQQLAFLTNIDYSNVIIDEYVWKEINQVLAENPAWKSITVSSPSVGRYVMTGFLKTRKQADSLNSYINQNFPYLNLLDKRVVVEEELRADILQKLTDAGFVNVTIALENGELQIKGTIASGQMKKFLAIAETIKALPGIRTMQTFVNEVASEQSRINVSGSYKVTGYSSQKNNLSVVVNGRILTKGDAIDGMVITDILPNAILLEKDGFKYRIDFNR